MDKIEIELRGKLRKEADETLFPGIELSVSAKARIRELASAETPVERRFALPRAWIAGAAAIVAAVAIVAAWPQTEQSADPAPPVTPGESLPADNGSLGSELSSLVTTSLDTAKAAADAFGAGLLVPGSLPEGYALSGIVAVSEQGATARDVVFSYASGDKSLTVASSRLDPAFPRELFSPAKVGSIEAFVFEQPGMTELFWTADGIHYTVTGNVTADEAIRIAESAGK